MLCYILLAEGEIYLMDYFHLFQLLRKRLMWSGWIGERKHTQQRHFQPDWMQSTAHGNTIINQLYHDKPPADSKCRE